MRVTQQTLTNNLLRNLNSSMTRLDKLNQQLATGKQIQVPSDNPAQTGIILRLNSQVRSTEQYIRNADAATSWLEATDAVMQDMTSIIHRANDLVLSGANETNDDTAKEALADEIAQLFENVLELANSTHNGRYLFAGQKVDQPPFEIDPDNPLDPPTFTGDGGSYSFELSPGASIEVNTDGKELFEPLFEALQMAHDSLVGGVSGASTDEAIAELDDALTNVLTNLSQVGAKQNRVELSSERLKDLRLNVINLLNESENIDYAETFMYLKTEEFIYQTALSVGARLIQPTLVDFLR